MVPKFVARTGGSRRQSALPTLRVEAMPTDVFRKPGKPEKSAAPIYGGWFRVLSGGSNRVQA